MYNWEAMFIQYHHHRKTLITEQLPYEDNILYNCIQAPWSDTRYVNTETAPANVETST